MATQTTSIPASDLWKVDKSILHIVSIIQDLALLVIPTMEKYIYLKMKSHCGIIVMFHLAALLMD